MSAIFIGRPISAAAFTTSQSRNFEKPTNFFAKGLNLSGELGYRRSISWCTRSRKKNSMKGFGGVVASSGDEGIKAFEQEALVEEGSVGFVNGGLEATLNSLSKWLVAGVFSALILWRHDAEALWAAMGAVLNAILSVALKKVLNQERPVSTLRSDPGMPSSHGQSIFYTLTFLNLSMIERYGMNPITATLSGLFFMSACYFSWLRVSQQLHTRSQVLVGALIGFSFSVLWFWLWHSFVLDSFVSRLWVRILVVVGSISFCLGFLQHVYRKWVVEER